MRVHHMTRGTAVHRISAEAAIEVWSRPKIGNPLLSHFAIVVRQRHLGLDDLVVDLRGGEGVRVVSVAAEAEGNWQLVRQLDSEESQRAIAGLLDACAENPQWSVGYNCEDFANRVADGTPRSGQRQFLTVAGILGFAVWWDARQERLEREARRRARRRRASARKR
ncbi:MAG: hypothetical protein AB7I45_16850 [Planctomycetota bacterium]